MVAYTSLNRALACAVGMQQAIERHNNRADDPDLGVRIGISHGLDARLARLSVER